VGSRDHETAGNSRTAADVASVTIGLAIMIIGLVFSTPISAFLCRDESLRSSFQQYMNVLLLSAPFEIVILTYISFLPSAGYPGFSTVINVVANVVNILMDYVYIRVFHMGVVGAAWATLTGYLCAGVLVVLAVFNGKLKMYFTKNIFLALASMGDILRFGRPDAVNQIGLGIQSAVCNSLTLAAGGKNAMVAFSLCLQTRSVMSIFVSAIIGSSGPILGVLHGQRDYKGEAGILKTSMTMNLIVNATGTIAFLLFAPQVAAIYNITDPTQFALSLHALRIYVLVFVPRYTLVLMNTYLKVIDLSRYSTLLSALDSFAAIVPMAYIMVKIFGLNGFWWTFPLTAFLLLAFAFICNLRFAARSKGTLIGPLLIEHDEEAKPIVDVTITEDSADISQVSMKLQEVCEEHGMEKRTAMHAALAVEEIAVYASNKKSQSSHMDILVRLSQGHVEIDFRSLGEAFNPMVDDDVDMKENVQLLRSIASRIENEYILGMNSTRIII
jgi:Na+-driven multidrug efflux pump/predicted nucleotidyltransferase